jgi:hypothetical protein
MLMNDLVQQCFDPFHRVLCWVWEVIEYCTAAHLPWSQDNGFGRLRSNAIHEAGQLVSKRLCVQVSFSHLSRLLLYALT